MSACTAPATAFGPIRQVDAGDLDVGYVDAGPPDGPAVVLLHGWPYDIHSFADVTPLLTAAGLPGDRPVPPRATARPASSRTTTVRNGQQAALARRRRSP